MVSFPETSPYEKQGAQGDKTDNRNYAGPLLFEHRFEGLAHSISRGSVEGSQR